MKRVEKITNIVAAVILVPTVALGAFIIICDLTGRHFKSDETIEATPAYSSEAVTANAMSAEESFSSAQSLQVADIPKTEEGQIELMKQSAQEALEQSMIDTSSEEMSFGTPAQNLERTGSNKEVLDKAKDYLNYSAFSHSGLISQLEFDGFTTEDATYTADNCGADWNKQAAVKAQDYLNYSSFSSSGLIAQLEFDGFTTEQAKHGASAVGY